MGKQSAPEPTPPRETSAASTGTNVSTAIANAYLQNVDEVTPDGTRTFDQVGSQTVQDPYTGQSYEIPRFQVTTSLSPEQQAIADQTNQTELGLATLANDQTAFLNDYMGEPFSYDPGQHEDWALGLRDNILGDSLAQDRQALEARLASQGIGIGTEAHTRAMGDFDRSQAQARDQFLLDSYGVGMDTALAQRNQPLNEISALLSGSQVNQPRFSTAAGVAGAPTVDNASIIANSDAAQMAAWQQQQAALGSTLSAFGGLFALSDEEAKTDVERIGKTEDGLGLYKYRYKGRPETQVGLMAQEVQKKRPGAVKRGNDGYLRVNYERALG